MDNQKLILFLGLSLVVMMLFQSWEEQNTQPKTPVTRTSPATDTPSVDGAELAAVPADAPGGVTSSEIPQDIPAATSSAFKEMPQTETSPVKSGKRIHVQTDLLDVEIDTVGGDLRKVSLLAYPVAVDKPDDPFLLLNDILPRYFVTQTGLISKQGSAPGHRDVYDVEQTEYKLADGSDEIKVTLNWSGADGMSVSKIYTFRRDDYVIDVDYVVSNNGGMEWKGYLYRQLQRTEVAEAGQSKLIYTFMGGVVSTTFDKYEKITFDEMAEWKPQQSYIEGGWVAMLQHYFLAAIIPSSEQLNHFYTKAIDDTRFIIGMTSQEKIVNAGQMSNILTQFYIGPKDQYRMEEAVKDLDRTVDYGVLWVLAKPIFTLLNYIHGIVGNWGWSIIILTLLIKLVFYKLSEASFKSMARMRRFQPKIADLRERYGSDKQRMSQALMALYKKEKINPLGGCLPMLVQIPVFISLYWVLLESVELRQADFIFWFNDLSTKDPYYVLPLLMGITMFVQQKLNPAPMDPVQQKVMMALPFIFTAFFAFFPSGLVLYWITNNLLTISQQYYILRKYEKTGA
jgi:YidC/Oxa1 family membrane protein insertase